MCLTVSYGVLRCLVVSNNFVRHPRTPSDMCLTKMLDTIGHMSDDFVRHMSYKTLVFDIPLLPLGNPASLALDNIFIGGKHYWSLLRKCKKNFRYTPLPPLTSWLPDYLLLLIQCYFYDLNQISRPQLLF